MQAGAELVGLDVLAVLAATVGDDRAAGGDAREAGEADVLPGDPHPPIAYAR